MLRRGDEIIRFLSKFSDKGDADDIVVNDVVTDFVQNSSNIDVNNFFVQCRKRLLNGNDFVVATLVNLIKRGLDDRVRVLWETCLPQSVMHRFYQMAVALSGFDKYDLSKAPELLRDALIESIDAGDSFTYLGEMIQICFHMENVVWPSDRRFPKPSLEHGENRRASGAAEGFHCRFFQSRGARSTSGSTKERENNQRISLQRFWKR